MEHDLKEATSYVELLTGSSESQMTFQTYTDSKEELSKFTRGLKEAGKRPFDPKAKVIHGNLKNCWEELQLRNSQGAGVFVTVNETDGKGRMAKNIVRVRAVFSDDDTGAPGKVQIPASLTVRSNRGPHTYWVVEDGFPITEFTPMQKRIASKLGTDSAIKDLSRVMRLPGLLHQKNPNAPFLVKISDSSPRKFSKAELLQMFPDEKMKTEKSESASTDFQRWVDELPTSEGSKNPLGGRNATLLVMIREGLGSGIPVEDLKTCVMEYCRRSGLDDSEGFQILSRQALYHAEKPFDSRRKKNEFSEANAFQRAQIFASQHLGNGKAPTAKLMDNDLFTYENGIYVLRPKSIIKHEAVQFYQKKNNCLGVGEVHSLITHIESLIYSREKLKSGTYLGTDRNFHQFIVMNNGVLTLPENYSVEEAKLLPYSESFFSLSKLPFEFNPDACCPIFDEILEQAFGDQEKISFLYEWFGYNLIYDTSMGKAVVYLGEGANSKSVVTTVQGQLIGDENFTAIGIDGFDPRRTFNVAATKGKLANICEDMNEVSKIGEGLLKSFITGGRVTVERKNRDPEHLYPTARLTFATNVLPRLSDSTDGLDRRLIILRFENQILDESKQNKNFIKPEWWRQSGELPGVFNKALKGLERLMNRGQFVEPNSSKRDRQEYRLESNSAKQFIFENLKASSSGKIQFSSSLYDSYIEYCKNHGFHPFGANKFSAEIKRAFPTVVRSTSMRIDPSTGDRSFFWTGIEPVLVDGKGLGPEPSPF